MQKYEVGNVQAWQIIITQDKHDEVKKCVLVRACVCVGGGGGGGGH